MTTPTASSATTSKLKLVLVNLAVMVLLLAVAFAALETHYRIRDWRTEQRREIGFRFWRAAYPQTTREIYSLRPGVYERTIIDGSRERFAVSSQGYRQPNFDPERAIDIAFYGDSFTAGHGVSEGERFTDILARRFPELNISNFAYNGGFTAPHYLLHFRLSTAAPSVLYVFTYLGNDCESDMQESRIISSGEGGYPLRVISSEGEMVGDRSAYPSWVAFLSGHSALFRRVFRRVYESDWGAYLFPAEARPNVLNSGSFDLGEAADACLGTFRHLASLADLCRARNPTCRLRNVLIPPRFLVYDDGSPQNHTRLDRTQRRRAHENPRLVSTVMQNCREVGIECVDLLPAFRAHGERLYFAQDPHWNVLGHQFVAELLATELVRPATS